MKMQPAPWIVASLVTALLIVCGSLYSAWHHMNQEVGEASVTLVEESPPFAAPSAGKQIPPAVFASSSLSSALTPEHSLPFPHPTHPLGEAQAPRPMSEPSPSSTSPSPLSAPVLTDDSGLFYSNGKSSTGSGSTGPAGSATVALPGSFVPGGTASSAGRQEASAPLIVPPGANVPAALGNPDAVANLSDAQKATIALAANKFAAAIESSGTAPNTPEYLQAWETAAYQSDEYIRGQFGVAAFNALLRSQTTKQ